MTTIFQSAVQDQEVNVLLSRVKIKFYYRVVFPLANEWLSLARQPLNYFELNQLIIKGLVLNQLIIKGLVLNQL